ncbi:MAG: LuxR C-terminal-related transcriptional regulator [Actinomycetes bacterium]
MASSPALQPLDAGWQALREGDWAGARALFDVALAQDETPAGLEGLGWCGYFLGDAELTLSARQGAYRRYVELGELASAARVAAWLAADHVEFRNEPAVSSGWLQRARRLLAQVEPGPDHGWLAIHAASFVIEEDPAQARELAAEALDAGRKYGVTELEVLGLATQGVAFVYEGDHAAGMRLLDEAITVGLAEPAELLVCIAWAGCYLITACELVRDYDRAGQWCNTIADFCERHGIGLLLGVCRAKYAGVLAWQGRLSEAEAQVTAARDALRSSRPRLIPHALVRLGDIRRMQGRLDEARGLYDECEGWAGALLGSAQVALDLGDIEEAVDLAERFLRRTSDARRVDRAGGLEVLIRGLARLGRVDEAQRSVDELCAIAERAGTRSLRASALAGEASLAAARGDHERARRLWEDAVDLAADSPFLAASIRLDLAECLAEQGRREAAAREVEAARRTFVELGAGWGTERAAALVQRLRHGTPGPDGGPLGALTPRQMDVLALLTKGLTNAEIATRLTLSEHTVHRHVTSILRTLRLPSRAAAAALASRHGLS